METGKLSYIGKKEYGKKLNRISCGKTKIYEDWLSDNLHEVGRKKKKTSKTWARTYIL
jgi:hypothetical protein